MRNKKGFALLEMLVAVAVVSITLTIAGVSAGEIKDSMSQMKAEATAKDIYINAQSKLTMLKASGNPENFTDAKQFSYNPEDYDGDGLSYLTDEDASGQLLYSSKENGGHWVIEFDKDAGIVFGVFWVSDKVDFYTNTKADEELRNAGTDELHNFYNEHNANLAYYGNEVVVDSGKKKNIITKSEDPIKDVPEFDQIETGFCYYEVYELGEVGYYIFSSNHSTLQDKLVVGDGYGVILGQCDDPSKVSISGTKQLTSLSGMSTIDIEGGYIYRFPISWMRANWLDNSEIVKPNYNNKYNESFYWDVVIRYEDDVERWGYSPYYALTATIPTLNKTLPKEVKIRSARQLNALSWMYSSYFNKQWSWDWTEERVVNTTFVQELDIDYAKYQFQTYNGREFIGQQSIGTDWGRFISNYDGKDHTIYNCKFLARKKTHGEFTYTGLFGHVSVGTIKNVHIDATTNNSIDSADYIGVLAAYVENATVKNCSVNNYTINFKQSSPYSGGNIEYQNARVGGLIGYLKCPQEDNSKWYSLVENCKVTNITIKAYDYMTCDSNTRHYQIGVFLGSAANNESNEGRANHITIKNCSAQGTIQTKSYGQGSSYCYIGDFAGAIRKWVKVENVSANVTDEKYKNHVRSTKGYLYATV